MAVYNALFTVIFQDVNYLFSVLGICLTYPHSMLSVDLYSRLSPNYLPLIVMLIVEHDSENGIAHHINLFNRDTAL